MEQRRQRRIQASVPVHVRGTDARGETFEDATEALDVSRRGFLFLTKRDLTLFANLTVLILGRGPVIPGEGPTDFFTTATVVRVQKDGEFNRIGVRFVGATLSTYTSETA